MAQRKILIADDEEDVLNIVAKKLKENNYDVTAVSSGKGVIDKCKLNKPDLIILDIAMPDMDGYAVASVLRKDNNLKDVPILFLTGKELERAGIEKRIAELGAYDYLTKPCEFKDILAKIKEVFVQ